MAKQDQGAVLTALQKAAEGLVYTSESEDRLEAGGGGRSTSSGSGNDRPTRRAEANSELRCDNPGRLEGRPGRWTNGRSPAWFALES